jgi:tricorn protease
MKRLLLAFAAICLIGHGHAQDEARLLRFPSVSDNQIVFTYAGNLYLVPIQGGMARKITSDIGFEMFAHFSPDGKTIAFTGQYDGNTEVYTIPAEGGVPKRITYTATLSRDDVSDRMGPNNIVMGWTPDGKSIIYRSRVQSFNDFIGQLFEVPAEGGMSKQMPLPEGGFCSFSPDGKQFAYNRVFREFRTWKHYRGGMADDVWIYDFDTKKAIDVTNNPAQDIFPMWIGNDIYFLSDRDWTMNLFVYHSDTKITEKLTTFSDYDIKFPSFSKEYIVFENGGYIYSFNVKTRQLSKVNIQLTDDDIYARPQFVDASKRIFDVDLSPNGERALFSARGDVFSVPTNEGITRDLTPTSNAFERNATWSPDGKWVAYLSDISGEYEIYRAPSDGSGKAEALTSGADTYKFTIGWSPDSKNIIWNDEKGRLQMVNVDTKKVTLIRHSEFSRLFDFSWSPDSKWIAFADGSQNNMGKVYLYQVATAQTYPVTDGWYSSYSPQFSNDGKYLLFTSDRDFNPVYSNTEWNHAYVDMSRIYLLMLSKNTPSPFAPEDNEVKPVEAASVTNQGVAAKSKKKVRADSTAVSKVQIDLDDMASRIVQLPIEPANYYNVSCVNGTVYYNMNSQQTKGVMMKCFDLKKKKETSLGEYQYALSANDNKMLVAQKDNYQVIDLPMAAITMDKPMDLSGMKMWVDYHQEWKQIFDESWRQMRDFFYVPNMHGLDWKAVHDKYAVIVPYVSQRADLTYIIGEMIGELNIGHSYVNSGDMPAPKRIQMGLLGAQLDRSDNGFYRVDKILEGATWSKELRSPLMEPGVNVSVGNYIVAINKVPANTVDNIYQLLIGKADKEVELMVNTKPSLEGARRVIVVPIASETALYYYDWVQNNIRKVSEATNGEVGYIHIPDMGVEGLNEFAKYFYPQLDKKALIVDDRGNGGGNVSPMILERLSRVAYRATMRRNSTEVNPVPDKTLVGPKVLLINKYSASDGDLFPYGFRELGLGTIVGTRTWGGVVGIEGSLPYVDGAELRTPEFTSISMKTGQWIIEGHGVDPNVVVENDPATEYQGDDQQLDKAIEIIKDQLKDRQGLPTIPPAPVKAH